MCKHHCKIQPTEHLTLLSDVAWWQFSNRPRLVLFVCFRHQYIRRDGVQGSAGGEDREDLSWRSRLHLWSAQGETTVTDRVKWRPFRGHVRMWFNTSRYLNIRSRDSLFCGCFLRLDLSWCLWTESLCTESPTCTPSTSSEKPSATRPKTPCCLWSKSPKTFKKDWTLITSL